MSGFTSPVDPDGLMEYSVVFSDRSLNHMSKKFQKVMTDISSQLKKVYNAETCILVPGGGSFAMEAVARQFGGDKRCLVIRNGWFSFRWTQIFETCKIADSPAVMKARRIGEGPKAPFQPAPIEEVVAYINTNKPDIVFAPHVETSAGMILPNDYIKAVGDAVHANGGLFVLDCVASGCIWIDMKALSVDVLISAPQKGWSASPSCGLVMLSALARERIESTTSSSFACDLKKWMQIMGAYENGGHAYHATMPTDALLGFRDTILETEAYGFDKVAKEQQELGDKMRAMLESKGFKSVAADGFKAPGVIVSYTDDADVKSGKKFAAQGAQIAAGVPLQCDEGSDFMTFRIGLFGLDKIHNVDRTVDTFAAVLDKL